MRCRWLAWWKGLPALALLIVAAVVVARAPAEQDLTQRAEALLVNIGESWARASFDGRDAKLEGEALSEEARVKVRTELAALSGVRSIEDRTTLLPERRPFTFSVVRDGSKLHLSGYVPSRWSRKRIVEAAAQMAPGVVVTGDKELTRARGVPAGDFAGVVIFGIQQLAKMPSGRVTIADNSFSIEGRAPDFATYDALEVTVRSELPTDFDLARFAVLPPAVAPFVWSAEREQDGVKLSGYIPLGDARRALLDLVRSAVPGAAISDQLRLADGSPPTQGWLKAVAFSLDQLGRLPDGKVALSGTTISIEGTAPDFASYDALAGARRNLPEGYTLTRFAVEPPTVSPFIWGVLNGASGLRLTGFAPSENAKKLALDAVRAGFPGLPVSDEMRIAAGGPPAEAWASATAFGIAQLARLRAGSVRGLATTLTISGEAVDSAAYLAVSAALSQSVPKGFALQSDVRPPVVAPYVFGMRKDGEGLTISGFYPTSQAHGQIIDAVKRYFPGLTVNDVSALAQGAPDGFEAAARLALRELSRLDTGEVRFDDRKLRLTGTAFHSAAVVSIGESLKQEVPAGFSVDLSLDVLSRRETLDRDACRLAVATLLERGGIVFAAGGARLDPVSYGLLDRVAAAAAGCPDVAIEISVAHADIDSDQAAARARAVIDYLAAAGIAPERLWVGPLGTLAAQSASRGGEDGGILLIVR
ncbi:flagellar motor protein MotB [Ancylobacter sp. Lp-2]|uniref:flagellar motor protein MotB n=1 Tax=Ancylobacter sp. Lp-2 TaxID=2881339 RepID=UPI001E64EE6F|nr:flagellar motor protein MotB [Ancylobacter sp. Lp-2]